MPDLRTGVAAKLPPRHHSARRRAALG